jgi:hypothetical protein
MLPAIVGLGLFTWVSFLYIGVRAKRSGWLAAAGLYFAGMVAVFAIDGLAGDGSALESVYVVLAIAMWFGGIVHGVFSNRNWLRWRSSTDATPWYLADDPTDPDRQVDLYVPEYDDVAFDPALEAIRSLSPPAPVADPLTPTRPATPTSPIPPPPTRPPAADTPASVAPPPPPPPPPPPQ